MTVEHCNYDNGCQIIHEMNSSLVEACNVLLQPEAYRKKFLSMLMGMVTVKQCTIIILWPEVNLSPAYTGL